MNDYENILKKEAEGSRVKAPLKTEGSIIRSSPSNIAIVKYWGKHAGQIPANASLSMTLSKSVTTTEIDFNYSSKIKGPVLEFEFEGKTNPDFAKRISTYLHSIISYLPWLEKTELKIRSKNTFPHSAGIASSASAMSSIALCLCSIAEHLYGTINQDKFLRKASFLARLGSGSASRSVYGKMVIWGRTAQWEESSDEYAIPVTGIHKNFLEMKDSILIIESGKKEVSSSLGHDLMRSNPYAKVRFKSAEENMQKLHAVVKNGDMGQFIDIMENEALSLHAMMMTSSPGFLLMRPNTLEAIQRIRRYRNTSGKSVGFTLDAGANVHVLFPTDHAEEIHSFIESELSELCVNGVIIDDGMGI